MVVATKQSLIWSCHCFKEIAANSFLKKGSIWISNFRRKTACQIMVEVFSTYCICDNHLVLGSTITLPLHCLNDMWWFDSMRIVFNLHMKAFKLSFFHFSKRFYLNSNFSLKYYCQIWFNVYRKYCICTNKLILGSTITLPFDAFSLVKWYVMVLIQWG